MLLLLPVLFCSFPFGGTHTLAAYSAWVQRGCFPASTLPIPPCTASTPVHTLRRCTSTTTESDPQLKLLHPFCQASLQISLLDMNLILLRVLSNRLKMGIPRPQPPWYTAVYCCNRKLRTVVVLHVSNTVEYSTLSHFSALGPQHEPFCLSLSPLCPHTRLSQS